MFLAKSIRPLLLVAFLIATATSCQSNPREVVYAANVRDRYELQGQLRLAQNQVEVSIDGEEDTETAMLTNTGNYFVIFADDLAGFVRAVQDNREYVQTIAELKQRVAELEAR